MDAEALVAVRRMAAVSEWPPEARVAVMDLALEIDRLRRDLLGIYRLAALHFMGGAFDPGHMRVLANLAAVSLGAEEADPEEAEPPYLRASQQLNMPLTPLQVDLIEAYPDRILGEIERLLGGDRS